MPRSSAPHIYQLKISLKGAKPPIWRRVLVKSDIDLGTLHEVIQAAMGWLNCHMHQFVVGGTLIGVQDDNDFGLDMDVEDERKWRIDHVLRGEKDKLHYEYDFGDDLQHQITLEKILPFDPKERLPRCVTGRRACPPEDCGGIWGYEELLEILDDPTHPEYDEILEWLGDEFDPAYFETEVTNAMLKTFVN